MAIAVEFDHVSKRFSMHQARPSSFKEALVGLFRRSPRFDVQEDFWVLRDVSFQLEQGKTIGFIGENGAGKSTTLKLISRILAPNSGRVRSYGRVGALLELGAGFHPDLTGRENIFLNGALLGMSRAEIQRGFDRIVDFAELERFIDMPVKHYSSGMYVRLGFAVAVHMQPDVLLIDEVLAVGDATFQHKCLDRISQMRRDGVTIVLVSHGLESIQTMCDEVIWMEDGIIQAQGHAVDVVMSYLSSVAEKEKLVARAKSAQQEETTQSEEQESELAHRWGSGKIRIEKVSLCDAGGNEATVFETGTPLEIRLHYYAAEPVATPVFGIGIHHQNGVHICGPNTGFSGLQFPLVQGKGVVRYLIPNLPLLSGAYLVSVAAHHCQDLETYDYHDRLYPFRVYQGQAAERYGMFAMNGTWSLQTGSTQASELTGADDHGN